MKKIDFYKPKTIDGAAQLIDSTPKAIVAGGFTQICRSQSAEFFDLGEGVICLSEIPEMRAISRNERRIEFGAAVPLSEIENLENSGYISRAILSAIKTMATPAVRNFATLGGNLCSATQNPTLTSPFLALDAILEFRQKKEVQKIPMAKFLDEGGVFLASRVFEGQKRSLLTKISIKLRDWSVEKFHRFDLDGKTGNVTVLINAQKNVINDLRIAFAGTAVFRDKALENMKIGQSLPLSRKSILDFLDAADEKFCETFSRQGKSAQKGEKEKFLNAIFYALSDVAW